MSVPVKFIQFGVLQQFGRVAATEKREHDLVLMNPMAFTERAVVRVPEGWKVASVPGDRSIETPFGRFVVKAKAEGDAVSFERTTALTAHRLETEDYAAFRDMVAKATNALTEKIVLERAAAPEAAPAEGAPPEGGGK